MTIACSFLRADQSCQIASELAGTLATSNPSACAFCTDNCDPPRAINNVTVSLAMRAADKPRNQFLLSRYGHLLRHFNTRDRIAAIEAGTCPGSQLWNLLKSIGVKTKPGCTCIALAEKMNRLGVDGCREERPWICEQIRTNLQRYGWGELTVAAVKAIGLGLAWQLDVMDPIGSAVDEAIRLAELADHAASAAERSRPSSP